jgi:hypothetical protein
MWLHRKEPDHERVYTKKERKWDIPGHHLVNLNGLREPSQTHNG